MALGSGDADSSHSLQVGGSEMKFYHESSVSPSAVPRLAHTQHCLQL